LGKSTAPYAAAINSKVGYAVLENGTGTMSSLDGLISGELRKNFPNGGKEGDVVKKLQSIFYHYFIHLFNKCADEICKHKTTNLRGRNLNDYDISTFIDDVATLKPRTQNSLNMLTSIVENENFTGHFIFHFDEMQLWAFEEFTRDASRDVDPTDFRKYYLLAFCDSLQDFKGTFFRCIISGTNVQFKKVLQRQSQMKFKKLILPLFSEEAIFQLLELFCHLDHLDKDQLTQQIISPLAGCVRSVEYFLKAISERFANFDQNSVTLKELDRVFRYKYE
jgi:hypothetical protein